MVRFAERYRIPVASGAGGYFNFPARHPLHMGRFSMRSDYARSGVDLALMVGARDFGIWRLPSAMEAPMDARIVRTGLNTGNMGRNYPTDLALVGDVKQSLADLDGALESRLPKVRREGFGQDRDAEARRISARTWRDFDSRVRGNFGMDPMHPDEMTHVMARTIARNAVVVGEVHSVTASTATSTGATVTKSRSGSATRATRSGGVSARHGRQARDAGSTGRLLDR